MNFYTVYDLRTDEVLAQGTSRECTEILGFSSSKCFRTMVSRAKAGRSARYAVVTASLPAAQWAESSGGEWEEDVRRRWRRLQRTLKGTGRPEN